MLPLSKKIVAGQPGRFSRKRPNYNQQQNGSINAYYDIDSLLAAGNIALANVKNNQASQTNDITQTQNAYNALLDR